MRKIGTRPGTWQVAARYSSIDLGRAGPELDNLTPGVNWYPNKNLRFTLDCGMVLDHTKEGTTGCGPRFLQARAQFYW